MIKLKFAVGYSVESFRGIGVIDSIFFSKDQTNPQYAVSHNDGVIEYYCGDDLTLVSKNGIESRKILKFNVGDCVFFGNEAGSVLKIVFDSSDDSIPYCVEFDDGTYDWFSEDDLKTLEQGEKEVGTNFKFKAGDRVKTEAGDGVIEGIFSLGNDDRYPYYVKLDNEMRGYEFFGEDDLILIETVDSEQKEIADTYNFNVTNLREIDLDGIFDENGESFVSIPGCKVGVLLIDASLINNAGILTGLRFLVVPMQEKDVDQYLKSLSSLRKLGKEKKVVVKSI